MRSPQGSVYTCSVDVSCPSFLSNTDVLFIMQGEQNLVLPVDVSCLEKLDAGYVGKSINLPLELHHAHFASEWKSSVISVTSMRSHMKKKKYLKADRFQVYDDSFKQTFCIRRRQSPRGHNLEGYETAVPHFLRGWKKKCISRTLLQLFSLSDDDTYLRCAVWGVGRNVILCMSEYLHIF